ncbi:MAG TPA: class I SAM-dependent methyltransferase [Acidobacteriaceae bacterium]|nr:class I SAM-dependent methyltransferase [Acidobacteriaceae bacterium]
MNTKIDYGIDAPGVIRNLLVIGVVILAGALLVPPFHMGSAYVDPRGFWITGVSFLLTGGLMLLYSLKGKFRHRDRMLALAKLRGDEDVLDVGTGRGLLLVGAAKKLVTGRAVGLDIWKTSDLSANARAKTETVLEQEGVTDRCRLLERPAQDTGLPDASFDVIVSNLCLHNISARAERDAACREIVRLLKTGGAAIISDFRHTGQYAKVFQTAGLTVRRSYHPWDTFPPLTIVEARKAKLD